MELRSGRRLRRSSSPSPSPHDCFSRPSTDLISSLPDEMLLLVLARLRCVRAAVQTSLLSRRWRGLWMGLTDLIFRGIEATKIEALFRRFGASTQVSTLDICLPQNDATTDTNSLLRAAVRLSPGHLVFTLREPFPGGYIELPCFPCTTSIELDAHHFWVEPPRAGEFTALDSLSVTGTISDIGSWLNRCPRLRLLSITYPDKCILALPPAREFPMLEKLFLSGRIVDPGPLLNSCERLRELSITQGQGDTLLTLPPFGEFPVLENLSLSGNIAELGTLLNRCPRLRVLGVTFSGMALGSLEAALTTLEEAAPRLGLVFSLLGIGVPCTDDAGRFGSILRAAARLSPQELIVFSDDFEHCNFYKINADLPCFPHATSIKMSLQHVCFTPLPSGKFSMLERLSLTGRRSVVVDIGTLVANCPCLRVLEVTVAPGKITVHSASLQKLAVLPRDCYTACEGIDIVTPELKELHLDVHAYGDIGVSISAPVVEKLTWQRRYNVAWGHVYRPRLLHTMVVETIDKRELDTCWQLPHLHHVLSFHLNPGNSDLNFAKEMEKLPVTNFSVLELNFRFAWHVYGALVLQLLRMCRIRAATKKLKVMLPSRPKAKQACERNCACDKPKNWRMQSIFYTSLEEVEINGFNGEDHEHDFLRIIFKCSPMLKGMTVTPSQTFEGSTTELINIFLAHPSVNCHQ